MNIRKFLNFEKNYYLFNREERNLAAIFYYALLINENLKIFLETIKCDFEIIPEEFGIYFEYSYLRDLWTYIDGNEKKRELILKFLKPKNIDFLSSASIKDFNSYFGAVPKPSSEFIQFPGNWSLSKYEKNINDNEEFLKICKFKWAFNIKPDIVIHTSNKNAVCIEAKLESGEGFYPNNKNECDMFVRRFSSKTHYVRQTELQKYLFEELIGCRTQFLFLVSKNATSKTHETIFWKEIFSKFNLINCPYFIRKWIETL
ncbi:MAG TPA: hypothetical protein PKY81_16815 [bacterium]|nr:hypothetical protein [bacterium]